MRGPVLLSYGRPKLSRPFVMASLSASNSSINLDSQIVSTSVASFSMRTRHSKLLTGGRRSRNRPEVGSKEASTPRAKTRVAAAAKALVQSL
jgi:hypothetical protein